MSRAFGVMFLLVAICGCQHVDSNKTIDDPREAQWGYEVTHNPHIVLTAPDKYAYMSLNGLKFGDDAKQINPNKISSVNEKSGWTVLRDANRFRVRDGKIDGLGVWDQKLIQQLGVQTQDDIPVKFGKPESTAKISTNVTIYQYQDGHLHVFWNSLERRLVGVEVTK